MYPDPGPGRVGDRRFRVPPRSDMRMPLELVPATGSETERMNEHLEAGVLHGHWDNIPGTCLQIRTNWDMTVGSFLIRHDPDCRFPNCDWGREPSASE